MDRKAILNWYSELFFIRSAKNFAAELIQIYGAALYYKSFAQGETSFPSHHHRRFVLYV